MKTKTIKTLLFCLLLCFSINMSAQPGSTSNDETNNPLEGTGPDQAANPIDTNVLVLVFLGVAMGYLYYRKVPKLNK